MVDLEVNSMKHKVGVRSPFNGFAEQAADVSGGVLELLEMQIRLARVDARDALQLALWPSAFLVLAASLAIAALPVILLGLASWIAQLAGISHWQSQLLVGGGGLLVAAGTVSAVTRRLSKALSTFGRSSRELEKNIAWLRATFCRTDSTT